MPSTFAVWRMQRVIPKPTQDISSSNDCECRKQKVWSREIQYVIPSAKQETRLLLQMRVPSLRVYGFRLQFTSVLAEKSNGLRGALGARASAESW